MAQGRILVAQGNKWTASKPILLTTQGRIQVKEGRLLYFPQGKNFCYSRENITGSCKKTSLEE